MCRQDLHWYCVITVLSVILSWARCLSSGCLDGLQFTTTEVPLIAFKPCPNGEGRRGELPVASSSASEVSHRTATMVSRYVVPLTNIRLGLHIPVILEASRW